MISWWMAIGLACVSALVAGLGTAFYYRRRANRRIRALSNTLRQLVASDLEGEFEQVEESDTNDLADLTESINQLASEVRTVIQRISGERNTMAALLHNMSDGIISTDTDGRVTNINQAARNILALPSATRLEGRSFMQVVRDHEVNALLQQTLRDGQERSQMLEVGPRRPQLQVKITLVEEKPAENTLAQLPARNALVVLQDLSELMRLERIRRDFVANISHELRTPLASIKLMIETVQSIIEDDPTEATQFLTRIDTEIDGLTQLVRELLELSRIESGQVKLNMRAADLRMVVEQAAERLRPQAARSGLDIVVVRGSDESFPMALADPERLTQVLINLIHNAIKFTPVGGTITLSLERERDNDRLIIHVHDTGVGIPPDDLDRIFERFYKVDKARAGNETGTGLGLAIAKHIIQAHGGEIWAKSQYGAGSTFSFAIPLFQMP